MKVLAQGNLDVYEKIIDSNFSLNDDLIPSTYWLILNFDDWTYGFVKDYHDDEFKKLEILNMTELEILVRQKKIEYLLK